MNSNFRIDESQNNMGTPLQGPFGGRNLTAFGSVGKINDQDEGENEVCESVIEEEITVQNETPQQHRDKKGKDCSKKHIATITTQPA
jgi:hypothetical protein